MNLKEKLFDFKKSTCIDDNKELTQNKILKIILKRWLNHSLFLLSGVSLLSVFFKLNNISFEQQINMLQQQTFSGTLLVAYGLLMGSYLIRSTFKKGNKKKLSFYGLTFSPLIIVIEMSCLIPKVVSSISGQKISLVADASTKIIQTIQHFF